MAVLRLVRTPEPEVAQPEATEYHPDESGIRRLPDLDRKSSFWDDADLTVLLDLQELPDEPRACRSSSVPPPVPTAALRRPAPVASRVDIDELLDGYGWTQPITYSKWEDIFTPPTEADSTPSPGPIRTVFRWVIALFAG